MLRANGGSCRICRLAVQEHLQLSGNARSILLAGARRSLLRTMGLSRVRKAGRKGGAELEHEHAARRAREG
jgi:hypothetical protein